ncbi:RIP metalloprotease RseP [Variovorax paradoxus]|uniref:RIP metalloprotease RseP n=1 Tax=Variovorax paradoxus TaxID=34073 RepID=UPI002865ADEE|nr:RIP metalloprotease RseP [Variovorax paradoxus]MDR6455378.1 regulator of sigma E protease [Variovorax paradoxus]
MLTVIAFVVALGLLIAVHEYGHYRVAVACGVKVLRFSVGFGRTLYRWQPKRQHPGQETEFVIGAFPFGGYVKMLDEREGPVAPEERHRAFNTQPLRSRAAIVAAGPIANLLLAVVLYTAVNWIGVEEPVAKLARPVAASLAEAAGLRGGEHITRAGFEGDLEPVQSFEDLRWRMTRGALDGRDLTLEVAGEGGRPGRQVVLPLSLMEARDADPQMFRKIGVLAPLTRPEIGQVMAGSAAERAGLRSGDVVRSVGNVPIVDGQQLREVIRTSIDGDQPRPQTWQVQRGSQSIELEVRPELREEGAAKVGRIGAYVGAPPEMVTVRQGPIDGVWRGIVRTWEVSALTVRMMGKMVIGEASLKNLSGPLTIADYAGKSASLGLTQYLVFLALISVSLGVLNLMPLPVLDGGHLMYYLWEGLTGKGVSDAWMERLQRGGVALLLVMMSVALFNDVTRLFG